MADEMRTTHNAGDVLDDTAAATPRFLHILNGDSVRGTLEQSDVPGAFVPYVDILHEGPVPSENGNPSWRETRARYLSASGYVSYADALRTYEEWDARAATFAEYDEVVLWFEHDLFDQLLLVRHLDWFSRRDLGRTALSLICIGEFPGFEPFHGLGQLDASQLASLLGTREVVSREQFALGQRAWSAFTSTDPTELDALSRGQEADELPYLAGALRRFLEEYPAVGTGLPRTERHVLEVLLEGARSPGELFVALQSREERVFMGDWTFWYRLREMARGVAPLVSLDVEPRDDPDLPAGVVTITDTGRAVLSGRADWVRVNGFDRWLGGVHLSAALGAEVPWRYDPSSGSVVGAR